MFKNLDFKISRKYSRKNQDIEEFITTPEKKSEGSEINTENILETKFNSISKKSILEKRALSKLLSKSTNKNNNSNNINSNSTSTRETTNKRPTSFISAFDNMPLTTQYISRNKKNNSTLFQNFISWNKKMTSKTMKKKKNKISFRNGNVSKFDFSKDLKNNPLCFFSSINSQKNNLTERKQNSPEKNNKNKNELFVVSKYNFPLIYEDDGNEILS